MALGGALEGLAGTKGAWRARWLARGGALVVGVVLIGSLWRDAWLVRSESRYMGSLARRLPRPSYFALTCIGLVRERQYERAKICIVRLDEAAQEDLSGYLAVSFFTELVHKGLLREDAALALSWLGPPAGPEEGGRP